MCFGFCDDGAAALHLNAAADFGAALVNMFGLVARYIYKTNSYRERRTGDFCETEFTRHEGIPASDAIFGELCSILNSGFLLPSSLLYFKSILIGNWEVGIQL